MRSVCDLSPGSTLFILCTMSASHKNTSMSDIRYQTTILGERNKSKAGFCQVSTATSTTYEDGTTDCCTKPPEKQNVIKGTITCVFVKHYNNCHDGVPKPGDPFIDSTETDYIDEPTAREKDRHHLTRYPKCFGRSTGTSAEGVSCVIFETPKTRNT